MKAPLNTDNWSGSIKSNKAPLNTDDWNGFISAEMSRKLSQNCQCVTTPCNCGAVYNVPTLPPKTVDEVKNSIATYKEDLDKEVKVKFGDPLKNKKWIVYGLIAVAGYFAYKKFKN